MKLQLSVTFFFALCMAVTSGCEISGMDGPPHPTISQSDAGQNSDGQATSQMEQPLVDPLPEKTCKDVIAIQGSAPSGSSIIVVGGEGSSVSTDVHPATGHFCLATPLKKNASNTLQIYAQHPDKGLSAPVTKTILHEVCQSTQTEKSTSSLKTSFQAKNIALGATVKSSSTPEPGNNTLLTDGNYKTYAKYTRGCKWGKFCGDGWVMVNLGSLKRLGKIVVKWKDGINIGGADFAREYKVLTATVAEPGDPNLKNGFWNTVPNGNVLGGDGDIDTFDKDLPVAQYVALWLEWDGQNAFDEWFAISEIEIYDAPENTTPQPTAETNVCDISSQGF